MLKTALKNLFTPIKQAIKKYSCQRAVLVGHNAWFDLLFLKEAIARTKLKSPFHSFTCFDTRLGKTPICNLTRSLFRNDKYEKSFSY